MTEEERRGAAEKKTRDGAIAQEDAETPRKAPSEDTRQSDAEGGAGSGAGEGAAHEAKERDDVETPWSGENLDTLDAPRADEEAERDAIAQTPDAIEPGGETTPPPGSADAPAPSAPASPRAVRRTPTHRAPRPTLLKPLCEIAAALLLFWGLYSVWTSWRLNVFCDDVQQAVNAPDGIGKLSVISDWRVREIAEGTLQVSRGDGAYTVYVWRLSGGGYLVDSIARRP